MRTLVADGNFKQDHLRSKNPQDDIALSDGQGYMVGKDDFDRYISSAPVLPTAVMYSPPPSSDNTTDQKHRNRHAMITTP